jgi:hypothetical protein
MNISFDIFRLLIIFNPEIKAGVGLNVTSNIWLCFNNITFLKITFT